MGNLCAMLNQYFALGFSSPAYHRYQSHHDASQPQPALPRLAVARRGPGGKGPRPGQKSAHGMNFCLFRMKPAHGRVLMPKVKHSFVMYPGARCPNSTGGVLGLDFRLCRLGDPPVPHGVCNKPNRVLASYLHHAPPCKMRASSRPLTRV